ncbi:BioY protein [Deinococcus proteolyticus MRP]|uniref:Biotin transporter n=1 Tax=Deinococcus proteolyticus (strain ATCC 35074 / DSM 20540 / JCM 6276 / NBRC 101906 / NCIMB 13154 / VKM Ac-1939 / CCM 2703 / MRP) TaxID=693977 RepID=F0RNY5_DEIPM|nr:MULTISPECIES: biotin transporter BioY [Deinococcus]ADY26394.1 BioY protein [Deinococcus proteolyticus MRP]MCY1702513.1 biotin transporter BioY [Deinococcus sp. SL84]
MTQVTHPTLAGTLAPAPSALRDLFLIAGGALLMGLIAQAEIPLQPVPVTLQTLGVLLIGAALGWKRGFAALALYLAMGAAGLPVFAGGSAGIAKFAGPTAGYLLSYPFAAAAVGYLVERFALDRRPLGAAAAMLVASVIIYALGLTWLGAVSGMQGQTLLNAGLTPFLLGDALKIGLAAVLLPAAWAFVRK